jgi:hypothetical protein
VALLDELPDDSRTVERDTYGWTVAHELAATQVDVVSALMAAYSKVHSGKKGRTRPPEPVPRPWRRAKKDPNDTPAARLVALARRLKG